MFGNNTFAFEYSGYGEGPAVPPRLRHRRSYGHRWWHHGHEPFQGRNGAKIGHHHGSRMNGEGLFSLE